MELKKTILFYKPQNDYGCFSNWYECSFSDGEITYTSSEQYMMYKKAVLFKDDEIAQKILKETDLLTIKHLGREVKNFDSLLWQINREEIMYNGLMLKFMQNEDIKEILLSTNDAIIAEASPRDKIWGIGMGKSNPLANDPTKWKGKNLLGKTLMSVRNDIRNNNS